jgi:hypothetical protein
MDVEMKDSFSESQAKRMEVIKDLQKQWRCEVHLKDKDVYCWQSDGLCYTLVHNNIVYWAIEIVSCPTVISEQY